MSYQTPTIPDHIKYIRDTIENRKNIEKILGTKPEYLIDENSYLEINILEKKWKTSLNFKWLYREQPPLITIEDLTNMIKRDRIVYKLPIKNKKWWQFLKKNTEEQIKEFKNNIIFSSGRNIGSDIFIPHDELKRDENMESIIKKLNEKLTNPDYRLSWIANLSMAYIDCERWYREDHNKIGKYLNKKDKHIIANQSAEYFLGLLTK